jgi:mono/diheme cytochrome c family protein
VTRRSASVLSNFEPKPYKNVSRETFLSDQAPKPYKASYVWFPENASLGAGFVAVAIGAGLAFPAISVQAFPDTYLATDIPYAATSIAAGLKHYENNCTGCHGVSGHGDGPVASSLPISPADLSAPHTALHTGGDLYWWVTHGITNSPMPAFGDVLTDDERWDIINFLGAFSVGYQARVIEPSVHPGQYWLAPPDFEVTDETGNTNLLTDYRQKSTILIALFSCKQENLAQETARFERLLAARGWPQKVPSSSLWRPARFVSPCGTEQPARCWSSITIPPT